MAASIRSVLRVVVFAHMALMHTYQELSTCTYSLHRMRERLYEGMAVKMTKAAKHFPQQYMKGNI